MKLAATADGIAKRLSRQELPEPIDWDLVRDECSSAFYAELTPSQLDRLADMVVLRLRRKAARPT